MSLAIVQELEVKTKNDPSPLLLDVRAVSKLYHLWESPRARLIYGLWSQVPRWAPTWLRTLAQNRKSELGHDFYALRDISLELRAGESVAILGRNGSGKSTLLQIICGVLQPSTGTVRRNSKRISALLELGSGFDPQFTGRENVYLNGTVLGLSKGEIDAKFERILDFAEIHRFIDQPVRTYSSGMMVRLAFAVQVLLDPQLLIVDEALAVGDIFFNQKCFSYMHELKKKGCSFLIVSHDGHAIQQLCERGIVLVEGRKHFEGYTRDAVREYGLTVAPRPNVVSLPARKEMPEERLSESRELESRELVQPERWIQFDETQIDANRSAKLTRWSCADESAKLQDHFFPGQTIRLFVEFECTVPVREASAGFAIRDRTGLMILAKHQYQIDLAKRICLDSPFFLQCEFSFRCRLRPGEYTVEFGLVDIHSGEKHFDEANSTTTAGESYEVLCWPSAVGRFLVHAKDIDPISRHGHFGIVDIDAQTHFRTAPSSITQS
jgi:lipopolysaccharide transport system ATP-binding protein